VGVLIRHLAIFPDFPIFHFVHDGVTLVSIVSSCGRCGTLASDDSGVRIHAKKPVKEITEGVLIRHLAIFPDFPLFHFLIISYMVSIASGRPSPVTAQTEAI